MKFVIVVICIILVLMVFMAIMLSDTFTSRKNRYLDWDCDSLKRISDHKDGTILMKFWSIEYDAYKEKCLK